MTRGQEKGALWLKARSARAKDPRRVQFPAPTVCSSQPPEVQLQWDPNVPSSGLCRYLHLCSQAQSHTHLYLNKNKIVSWPKATLGSIILLDNTTSKVKSKKRINVSLLSCSRLAFFHSFTGQGPPHEMALLTVDSIFLHQLTINTVPDRQPQGATWRQTLIRFSSLKALSSVELTAKTNQNKFIGQILLHYSTHGLLGYLSSMVKNTTENWEKSKTTLKQL